MNRKHEITRILDVNIQALERLRGQVPENIDAIIDAVIERLSEGGKVVVAGVGKSHHVGRKLAATLTSTGTPSTSLHPVEAMHGDLGKLNKRDVLLALSYSGETEELLTLLPFANQLDCLVVAITGDTDGSLARAANHVLPVTIGEEACPFNLAPTTSALVTLAMGDILAMLIHQARGFTREDYARLHPGGAIGNAVYLRVSDLMRSGDRVAVLRPDQTIKDAMLAMTDSRSGAAVVESAEGQLLGVVTDGDVRRRFIEDDHALDTPLSEAMTVDPIRIEASRLASDVIRIFETRNINSVVVVDEAGALAGMVDIQDLPKVKLL